MRGSSRNYVNVITPNSKGLFHTLLVFFCSRWDPEDVEGSLDDSVIISFLENLDIILAIALKSFILVYCDGDKGKTQHPVIALPEEDFNLVANFTEMVVDGLVRKALGVGEQFEVLLDFVVGIFSTLVRDQAREYCVRYIKSIRKTATISIESKCFQARFKTARRFLSLPCFVELNETATTTTTDCQLPTPSVEVSWLLQSLEKPISHDLSRSTASELSTHCWMSDLFLRDSLETSIAATQLIMKESMKSSQSSKSTPHDESPEKENPDQGGLMRLHSSAIGGIAVVHELLLRRLAMDARYQSDSMKARLSSMFLPPVLEVALEYAEVFNELPCEHAVRRLWMGCLLHVLQDAPELIIRNHVARLSFNLVRCSMLTVSLSHTLKIWYKKARRLVSILHTAGKSFEKQFHGSHETTDPTNETSWVRQECFNIICAALNVVVEICLSKPAISWNLLELGEEISSCYLFILSIDQSPVTVLRALGGAMAIVESNVDFFVRSNHANLERWVRSLLIAMNCISLSVRSIAVDFTLSLLSGLFQNTGSVDSLLLMYATILPAVAAQQIDCSEPRDAPQLVWPLRRSIADIEDATPEDDPRIDSQLTPTLKLFCRTCQAIIDGVLIEMRFSSGSTSFNTAFAADEESLYEAASFFVAECAPLQRVRWLLALCLLQESKKHHLEAAEALMLVAKTACNSLPHLRRVWYSTMMNPRNDLLHGATGASDPTLLLLRRTFAKHDRPSVATMCEILTSAVKTAVDLYSREEGMEQLAFRGVEQTLKDLICVIEEHDKRRPSRNHNRATLVALRRKKAEEEMCLRRASTVLSGAMNSLAEKVLDLTKEKSPSGLPLSTHRIRPQYVLMHVHGAQPPGFYESTTLPVFLEWGKPCICRVPDCRQASTDVSVLKFAAPYVKELQNYVGVSNLIVRTTTRETCERTDATYLDIFRVEIVDPDPFHTSYASFASKRFFHKVEGAFVETKVAKQFPCALSRQSSLLTTQITLASQ